MSRSAPSNDTPTLGTIDKRTLVILLGSVAVTLLLYYVVPYGRVIARPLLLLSTLVHELGHGVAAVITGGDFVDFRMWWDGSGVARHSGGSGRFTRAFIAAAGLLGPAFMAALGLWLGRKPARAKKTLAVFGVLLLVALALVVRGAFGMVFVAVVAALLLLIGLKGSARVAQTTLLFVASQLALAVFSRADYLFTATAQTGGGSMPSDVGQMSEALFLPYWFWGAVCALLSLGLLALGVRQFFKGRAELN
jgi:hypothetical protein